MRALLSVHHKAGVVELARGLADMGWELVASGGTAATLAQAEVAHIPVEDLTGAAEMLGGRVKTLHPAIHGGILADRSDAGHRAELATHGIGTIDLVVCNLYPFRERPGTETIDVGGPTMLRAAAKNHAHVGVVVDPEDYRAVLDELRSSGTLSEATRRRLARVAFAHTAAYDAAIVNWFDEQAPAGQSGRLPPTLHLALERAQELRYGENPHQHAARYREVGRRSWWDGMVQHSGKALSYLNLFDGEAAWQLAHELGELSGDQREAGGQSARAVAVIVKHANPCGVAVADDIVTAYRRAFDCDPMSAFGGIIALNRPVPPEVAAAIVANPIADVLIAPRYERAALDLFASKRRNMRVLEAPPPGRDALMVRPVNAGLLVQEPDRFLVGRDEWQVATKAVPTPGQWGDAELAWRICARTTSNAIVVVAGGQAVGVGAGQQNRVDPAQMAVRKAAGRGVGGAAASDAYFPFRDGLDALAEGGVSVVVQPGGSVRDGELVAAADEHGIAMVLTGERHFRH